MESIRVLFVSQEIAPYLPETEMSVISRNLPQKVQEKGMEIRTFMPKYGLINERRNQLHEVIRLSGMNLIISDTDHPLIIKVASIQSARMQVYFIDNEDYFQRKFVLHDEEGLEFKDNDERTIFFARGVIETVRKLRWAPDLIHCHGWFTGLLPLYIKKAYRDDPLFTHSKVIFSVYDDEFKKPLDKDFRKKILIEGISEKDVDVLAKPDYMSLMRTAIKFSDGIILASKHIQPKVLELAQTLRKPVLHHNDTEDYIDNYTDFYDKVLSVNKVVHS